MKKKTLGFALGAGGSRGVAHVGFLKAMEEAELYPDYISGCSMGSVIGAGYACGLTPDEMFKLVKGLRMLDLIGATGKRGGLFDTKKIRKLLEKHLGDPDFKDLKIPYSCVAVDLNTQSLIEFKEEGKVLDGVVASSCIPAIFAPIHRNGMRLIDGGVSERVPVKQVKAMGADVVVCVDVLGHRDTTEIKQTTLGVLLETLDLMDNARTERRRKESEDIIDFWLEPELGNMSQYSLKQVAFAYEKGYEIGKVYAPKIKRALEEK